MRWAALLLTLALGPGLAQAVLYPWGACAPGPTQPSPPGQPADGPGGQSYLHGAYASSLEGLDGIPYWLLEPADPKPAVAPVVAFLHGYGAAAPSYYRGWLDQLAWTGHTVVFPLYHLTSPDPDTFTEAAAEAVRDALALLATGDHVRPDLARFALVGHSAGGIVAANLAAGALEEGLPPPRAILAAEPGDDDLVPLGDLARTPAQSLLLALVGEEDFVVGDAPARRIYAEAVAVPAAQKDLVLVRSDAHGCPQLVASHWSPVSGARPPSDDPAVTTVFTRDALDYYAWWKLADALLACAFEARSCEAALGGGPEQRFMGAWTDGVPVHELLVTDP